MSILNILNINDISSGGGSEENIFMSIFNILNIKDISSGGGSEDKSEEDLRRLPRSSLSLS